MAVPVFSITVDDNSPTIAYAPFADTFGPPNVTAGWNPYYSVSGFAEVYGSSSSGSGVGNIGNGTSLHLTACNNAEFALKWNGTAVTIHGTQVAPSSSSLTYSIALDGNATTNYYSSISAAASIETAANDTLASFSNLVDGEHEIALTVHNPGASSETDPISLDAFIALSHVDLFVEGLPAPSPTATTALTSPTATLTTFTVPDDTISYLGQWSYVTDLLPDLPADGFHTSMTVGDSAHVEFNGTAITLAGLTTPSSGRYNISLDGTQYATLSARSSFTDSVPTVLFYVAGLEPTVMHTLEVVNAGADEEGEGTYLVVLAGGVNVTTTESSSASSIGAVSTSTGLPRGAVAAISIGATLAFIGLIGLIVVLFFWRRRTDRRKRSMLEHPQVRYWRSNWRRWFTSGAGNAPTTAEHMSEKGRASAWYGRPDEAAEEGVLEIGGPSGHNEKDVEDDIEENAQRQGAKGKSVARTRHASQNSDGSFSIELPELSSTPLEYPPTLFPSTPQPLSLRSQVSTLPQKSTSTSHPSSRPRGPREMHNRTNSRGILLSQVYTAVADAERDENTSPLRVEFAHQRDRPERRTERYLSTGALSLPQSLKQALSHTASEPAVETTEVGRSTPRPSTLLSFLDFSSSTSGSSSPRDVSRPRSTRRSRSGSMRSTPSSRSQRKSGSDRSTTSTNPAERRGSMGLSMTIGGGPTASRPSLTPNISLHTVPLPPPIVLSPTPHPTNVSDPALPDQALMMPSPTDSIPLTVSDIHFRNSVHSSASHVTESRRTSAIRYSGSHRPPHPPLPGAEPQSPSSAFIPSHSREGSQPVRSTIVQKLMGLQPSDSNPSTPLASAATFSEPRTGQAETASSQPDLPPLRPNTESSSAAGRPTTPGRTSLFPFGLGRHR
ncbi:hypothetical protein WOLCODRAFT_140217 [Wolfiporia cocos MD-104 SS10]|uniref:Uncharacterized protein n=1 Tax=Wolfiporia cocos (strain MD-104) TaxID=742152 RepID=A0A2H3J2Z9_WOLCO|nr:hypothetical protein WOLCODRAFT_140217 [Wolfiporia cocos MD-104 SS10]